MLLIVVVLVEQDFLVLDQILEVLLVVLDQEQLQEVQLLNQQQTQVQQNMVILEELHPEPHLHFMVLAAVVELVVPVVMEPIY
jgi:hypothetical protein